MSINNIKQRRYLYGNTFMKWKVEERVSEFEKTAIELTLAIHKFGYQANEEGFKKLTESIADFETMLEVAEETFPALRHNVDDIKRSKLVVLKKHTDANRKANKLIEKADELKHQADNFKAVIKSQQIKTGLLKRLFTY